MNRKLSLFIIVFFLGVFGSQCMADDDGSGILPDSLKELLDQMLADDLMIRQQTDSIETLFGDKSDEYKKQCKREVEQDKRHQDELEKIILKYGWPGNNRAGANGCFAAFVVLQHSSHEFQKKYLPAVLEAQKIKEISGSYVALLVDRIRMFDGEKQVYGSQVVWDEEKNGLVVYPIEDEEHVDERRAEVGLMPLAIYLNRMGIEYESPKSDSTKK
ncbi:MAG: DUF6624 domain-containing protein [Candidatus Zixiibacteriota bacterium]